MLQEGVVVVLISNELFYVHLESFNFISVPLNSVHVEVTDEYRSAILAMVSAFPNLQTVPPGHPLWSRRGGISSLVLVQHL